VSQREAVRVVVIGAEVVSVDEGDDAVEGRHDAA